MTPCTIPQNVARLIDTEQHRIDDVFEDILEAAQTRYHPEPRHRTAWRNRKGHTK